jgi:hypothetical protein
MPDRTMRVLAVLGAVQSAIDLHAYGDYTQDLPALASAIDHATFVVIQSYEDASPARLTQV